VKTNETSGTNRNYSVIFISYNGIRCVVILAEDYRCIYRKHSRKPILKTIDIYNTYSLRSGILFLYLFFLMSKVLTMQNKKKKQKKNKNKTKQKNAGPAVRQSWRSTFMPVTAKLCRFCRHDRHFSTALYYWIYNEW
jgi:hypothetical protein